MSGIEDKLIDTSRVVADIVTNYIGNNQDLFNEAMELVYRDEYPLSMRAARVIQLATYKHLNLIRPHIDRMIYALEYSKVDGVKRSFLKILAEKPLNLNEEQFGRLTDLSFSILKNGKEAIAIRAFAIDILYRIIKTYPEIKYELIPILEELKSDESVGLAGKCNKILKEFGKNTKFRNE